MSERYRLVFRGEVLDGQHPAVVRKRLAAAGRFDAAQLETLFSGKPVVLKRDADAATAARWQGLFRSAGARLRVLPLEGAAAAGSASAAAEDSAAVDAADTMPNWQILPVGSDLLRADERDAPPPVQVDTAGLSLAPAGPLAPSPRPAPPAPDVSHLSVADAGARLAEPAGSPPATVPAPVYEVAAVGADLSPRRPSGPLPPPPDVSHIRLADEG